jgi:eukaryotic-like serine/threonine-protein kinase
MAAPEQKYRIIDKIDSGGMAEIYRAEAELIQGMKRTVAIKRILPHLTQNEKFVAMFLDEARLSLYLNHANIVHVYDIGRSGDTYFIVMEYVQGVNLRSLSASVNLHKGFTIPQALFITKEVCQGLGYAHDMGSPEDGKPLNIVHRDISPPNILLSLNGEVKLVDFGLAKAATQVEHTDPGIVKGKFSYLSPEAASGKEVDWRSDIFACGIILFELLTGRRLFVGETDFQTVELVRQARIPSIRALNSEVPDELEAVVLKALALRPEDRFQHAYELQDALAQLLFSRGLKVTSRDIAQSVRKCMSEAQKSAPAPNLSQGVIDELIMEEVTKFTSLDNSQDSPAGAVPLKPGDLGGSGPLNPEDFADGGRNWATDIVTESGAPIPQGLEHMLEGKDSSLVVVEAEEQEEDKPKLRALLFALGVLILLGAASILLLHHFGYLGTQSEANSDLIPSEAPLETKTP